MYPLSNYVDYGTCRHSEKVTASMDVPYFSRKGYFNSPPESFRLPIYAEACARQYVALDPKPSNRARTINPRVLCFVDDCAVDSDAEHSNSEGSTS